MAAEGNVVQGDLIGVGTDGVTRVPNYRQVSTTTNGVAPAILTIAPTGPAGSLLKRLHTLRLLIKVSFTPTGGRNNTMVFRLTVSSPKPKPKHHRR